MKTRESVDKRRFLLEVFHKVGVEWVVGEESKAQKIFGELLSDGEGRGGVWAAPGFGTPRRRLALWPQNAARQRHSGTCTYFLADSYQPHWFCLSSSGGSSGLLGLPSVEFI